MESFSYFDLAVVIFIILLGLKGIIDGFIKELFGLIGIIGGIYIGSHYAVDVGNFINKNIFKIKNEAALSFIGFLVALGAFWLAMLLIGKLFSKLSSASGMGLLDRIAGFLFGGAKIFLIFSIISYALYNIEAVKNMVEKYTKDSLLFPLMIKTGSYIIKLNPKDITKKVQEKSLMIKDELQNSIENEAIKKIEEKILENNKTKKDSD